MNEPIINPWFFYAIDTLASVDSLSFILSFIFMCMTVIGLAAYTIESELSFNESCKKLSILIFTTIFLLFICLAVPSKDTMYKMAIASVVTPENIQTIGEGAEVVATKAMDIIVDGAVRVIQEMKK